MSTKFASRHTRGSFTVADAAGEVTIAGGGAVQVCGMVFTTGATAAVFTVTDDGTAVLFTVAVAASSSFEASIPWLADAGLRVQSSTATNTPSVVVFHNSPGV